MNNHNLQSFIEAIGGEGPAGQAPGSSPLQGAGNPANPVGSPPPQGGPDPSVTNPAKDAPGGAPQQQDVSSDPQVPDMPDDQTAPDFEQWKREYHKQAVKGDPQVLIDLLNKVRDLKLGEYQNKFVEDNYQIQQCRLWANVQKASAEIRKAIKTDLDQNNPSVSVVNHLTEVLQTMPELVNVFIQVNGYQGMKGELHRRYIAALIGGVQVGVGADTPDVIYDEREYSLRISTRFNAVWGNVHIGTWALKASDPEDYLEPAELKRLQGEGSPKERETLRERVIVESISEQYRRRQFIINVLGTDGTLYTLGWDIGTSLKAAYTEGKLVVKIRQVEGHPAMITPDGKIVPFMDVKIMFSKETGESDEDGKPEKQDEEFLTWRDGQLFLTGTLDTVRNAASSFQGIVLKEIPYQGNPSDLKTLARCVVGTREMLMRTC